MRKIDLNDCVIIQLTEIWQHDMVHGQIVNHFSLHGLYNNVIFCIGSPHFCDCWCHKWNFDGKFYFYSSYWRHGISDSSYPRENYSSQQPILGWSFKVDSKLNLSHVIHICTILYIIYIRTDRNVHLLLQDIETESVHCTSSSISSMMASFFRATSARSTSISLGGAPSSIQVNRSNVVGYIQLVISYFMHAEYAFLGSRKFHWLSRWNSSKWREFRVMVSRNVNANWPSSSGAMFKVWQ